MKSFPTKFEFACEVFGYDNAVSINSEIINNYYEDWKNSNLDFHIWKKLLKSRG